MARSRRSTTRSEGPRSPPKQRQVASGQASDLNPRSTRNHQKEEASSKLKKTSPGLPVVEEELENAETNAQDKNSELDVENELDSISLNGSNSTDDNEEWLQQLDHEVIIDSLGSLYQDALKLVSLLNPGSMPQIVEELNSAKTSAGRRYRQIRNHLQASLQPYRPDDGFIPVELILRKLIEVCGSLPQKATPDGILYLTNLAILVDDVIVQNDESKLHLLANSFPGEYIFGIFGEAASVRSEQPFAPLTDELIQLAISIRTQYFLSQAAKYQKLAPFDPDELLRQAFYDDDGQALGFEKHDDEDSVDQISSAYDERIAEIKACFSKRPKTPVDLKKLEALFPRQALLLGLVDWIDERKDELKAQVDVPGGVEVITQRLLSLCAGESEAEPAAVVEKSITSTPALLPVKVSDQSSSARLSNKIQQLKRIKARREAQDEDDEAPTRQTQSRSSRAQEIPQSPLLGGSDDGVPAVADDDDDDALFGIGRNEVSVPPPTQGSVVPSQKTAMILQVARRQAVQSNKENIGIQGAGPRFTDRQKGAKRVDWEDDASQRFVDKRKYSQAADDNYDDDNDDDDDDEEDDYEVDRRQPKRSRLSQARPAIVNRYSTREESDEDLGRIEDDDGDDDDVQREAERRRQRYLPPASTQPALSRSPLQVRGHRVSSRPPPSSAPATNRVRESSPMSAESSYPRASQAARANAEAKAMVRINHSMPSLHGTFKVQHRRAWTAAETERLMDMIALHGTGYSAMLKADAEHPDGSVLEGRGQVALKDKARNLKVDFLKAGRMLPDGFECVKIKATDVEKIRAMGMQPHGGPD